jgi:hypothetical protein
MGKYRVLGTVTVIGIFSCHHPVIRNLGLKMSKKKKNGWTIFRTQQEFAVGINSSYQSVPKTAKVLA